MSSLRELFLSELKKYQQAFSTKRVLKTMEEVAANTNEDNLASAVVVSELNDNLQFPDGVGFYPDIQNGERGYNTDPARGAGTFNPFSKGLDKMPVYTKAMQAYSPAQNSTAPQTYQLWNIDMSKFKKCRVEFSVWAGFQGSVGVASLLFNGKTIASGGNLYNFFTTIDLASYKGSNVLVSLNCSDSTARNNSVYAAVSLIFS